jgi:hypothetical protein
MSPRAFLVAAITAVLAASACGEAPVNVLTRAGNTGGCGAGTGHSCTAPSGPCRLDAECPRAEPWCEPGSGTCVECRTSADCSPREPYCHPARHQCVGCLSDTDCDPRLKCVSALGRCALSCADGTSCDDDAPHCDDSLRVCVACRTNADCPGTQPDCLNGSCLDCAAGECD